MTTSGDEVTATVNLQRLDGQPAANTPAPAATPAPAENSAEALATKSSLATNN